MPESPRELRPTDEELEAGIAAALQSGNLSAVRDILLMLSRQNPKRAAEIWDADASKWLEEVRRA